MKKILLLAATVFCLVNLTNAQPGSLDSSFGKNGIVKANIGSDFNYGVLGYQVLLQADTAIYALLNTGSYAIVTKRHSNGSVYSNYGENGYSAPVKVGGSHTLAIQTDGKILLAGNTFVKTNDFAVARFNTDGSLDNTFGIAGRQTTDFNSGYDYGSSVKVQSDGKIVVGGQASDVDGTHYALARYNTDGSLDKSFGKDGKVVHDFGFHFEGNDEGSKGLQDNVCYSIAIQADQKIVAAGYAYTGYSHDFAVARYNADGSLDSTFSNDGRQTTDFGEYGVANSIAIQKDGKIVLTGPADVNGRREFAVVRYTANGNLDDSFSGDGKQTLSLGSSDVAYTVAIQPDGNIVSVGYTSDDNGNTSYAVARFKTDGSIDKAFNENVKNTIKFKSSSEAIAVAAAKDGKVVVVGDTQGGFFLFRVNNDGTADKGLADNGILIDHLRRRSTTFTANAVQKDGKMVAGGYAYNGSNYAFAVARYNTNGSLDSAFGHGGNQVTSFTSYDSYIASVAIQKDGKIVAAGYTSSGNEKYFAVVRYNANGSLDNSFNGNGKVITDFGQRQNQAYSVAIQSDGKIVVGGSAVTGSTFDFALARYNTDGSLDKSFAGDGKQTTNFGKSADIHSIAIDNIGEIVAAGQAFTDRTNLAIARYKTNGELDNTFGNQGKTTTQTDANYSSVYANSLAIQADGKIVAAGNYNTAYNYYFALVRYNNDGRLDTSFSGSGMQYTQFESSSAYANTIAIQKNGKIVAGGYTEAANYSINSALARYNADGTADSSFGDNGKKVIAASSGPNYINSIAIASGKLFAVGYTIDPVASGYVGLVTKYLLGDDSSNTPPRVSLLTPADNTTFLAPANIKLIAAASDVNGSVSKVEFYNGTTLLHTETEARYAYELRNLPAGNYTFTAKAYDNSGLATTSAPVHISVVPDTGFTVRITKPSHNESFAAPGYIHFEAAAKDPDGTITKVEFYNGATLLRTEYKFPYTYNWKNVPAGTYSITARATNNKGAAAISAPVIVTVTSANSLIVSNKPVNNKTSIKQEISVKLYPNPATNIVNLYTSGLKQSKPADISIISISGIVLKKVQTGSAAQMQIDVSSLAKGVYTIKIVSGDKVMLKQFAKL